MSVQSPAVLSSEQAAPTAATVDRSNILIVDDRLDKRVVFRTILEELDQNIVTASSGEEALRWLLDNDCAVILLDVNMPGMDGLETAELIRSRRKSAHTPIIFITAFADEMHTARGYSLGAVDYILSPVVPNILRSKVKALVQLHRLNAELKKRADERVALAKEQAARGMAEEQQRRSSFLAEATQVMASSLDVETILRGASALVVPFLADYGAVLVAADDGSVRAHRAASVNGWEAYLGQQGVGFHATIEALRQRVMREGMHASLDRLTPIAHGDAVDDGPAGELHAFPLVTRGKTRGALILGLGPSRRKLQGADLSLADSLAGRAASALDNCLLYEEIQNADRRKNEFLATLSHELRNPLAPMRNALHILRADPEAPKARALLETMDRQVAQMTRLVEDLLDISRITRGVIELRRERVDVGAEVRNALESCQGALEVGGHELQLELPDYAVHVEADRARLQQVLENLILNAVKYTEPGGRISVAADAGPAGVAIHVGDNGIGIAPDKLAQVWDLFVQVDESPERTRKGLGIGLALVRDLVHRHGGSVEARSEGLGKGSTFTVRFPKIAGETDGDSTVTNEKGEDEKSSKGRRVLIVDDNLDAAETLAMMLDILGQDTRQAHDGLAAIDAAAQYRPQIVFMDIGLPNISGHEAAARIRKDLGMTDIYMVALSGYGTDEDKRKSLHSGFDAHMVKPLDPSALPGILAAAERKG